MTMWIMDRPLILASQSRSRQTLLAAAGLNPRPVKKAGAGNTLTLVHDPDSKATMVVDPAVADPVLEAASARGAVGPNALALASLGGNDPAGPVINLSNNVRTLIDIVLAGGGALLRDLDILGDMAKRNLVWVGVSVTTLDRKLDDGLPQAGNIQTDASTSDAASCNAAAGSSTWVPAPAAGWGCWTAWS